MEYEREEEDEATLHTFRSSFFVKQLRLNTGRNLEIFTTSQQHQSAAAAAAAAAIARRVGSDTSAAAAVAAAAAAAKPEYQFEHDE